MCWRHPAVSPSMPRRNSGPVLPVSDANVQESKRRGTPGVDKDLGNTEEGELAELILIDGDLITNRFQIRNVVILFNDGVGYDWPRVITPVTGLVGLQ